VQLILASASPRRRELLELLGLPFSVRVAAVPEVPELGEAPAAVAARLARSKAEAVLAGMDPAPSHGASALVIACDTIVVHNGCVLGKPNHAAEAAAMLADLRGRSHTVISAVALLDTRPERRATEDIASTKVRMRRYSDAELAAYVTSGDPLDKAGAYAIQHAGFRPVARCMGCYANVMGLPLCHLVRRLRAWSIEPVQDVPGACQAHNARRCTVFSGILAA
jgi:septum formation protein